jgi:photosystem II stability/assembly factor-like uncharacterized protein
VPCRGDQNFGISFRDQSTGWATALCAGALLPYFYATHDGGKTWQPQRVPAIPATTTCPCWTILTTPTFTSAQVATSTVTTNSLVPQNCQTSGDGRTCNQDAIPVHVFIYGTTNGGKTWVLHQLPGVSVFTGPVFLDARNGWFAAFVPKPGALHNELDFDQLYVTHDGGATWTPLATSANFRGGDMDFVSTTTGWALMGIGLSPDQQTLLRTTDGGHSWERLFPVVTG